MNKSKELINDWLKSYNFKNYLERLIIINIIWHDDQDSYKHKVKGKIKKKYIKGEVNKQILCKKLISKYLLEISHTLLENKAEGNTIYDSEDIKNNKPIF